MAKKNLSPSEHEEQVRVVKWCGINGIMAIAIPNGFHTNGKKDGRFYGMIASLKAEGVTPGFPDLIILAPGKRVMFVEMKRVQGSTTSKEQKRLIEGLNFFGHYAVVCKGADEAIGMIEAFVG